MRRIVPLLLAPAMLLVAPAPAFAAGAHIPLVTAGILSSIFSTIGHAVLGAFSWTVGLASKFLLTTLAGLVRLLIPRSWINQGLAVMEWIVSVPDYAGSVRTPGGGHAFGFGGINQLRELFVWLGLAAAPLSLTYATSRAMIGETEPVALPLARTLGVSVGIVSYGYWWGQAVALVDQITHAILTLPDVAQGLDKLMAYAVGGVALGGWQLIDLGLMGAIGLELLGLIFLKVVLILLGALLYATGPLMIGLVPTRAGGAIARAWASAVTLLFALGLGWATVFAVGALLIDDSSTAGPLIAGQSTFGSLMGGLLLALAGLASLWVCLKAGREAGGLLRMQLAALLALGHTTQSTSGRATQVQSRTTGRGLREYGSRLARASSAAGGQVAASVPAGHPARTAGRAAAYVVRRGVVGTAASGISAGTRHAARGTAARIGHTRIGAVAVRMGRAGTASWNSSQPSRRGETRHTHQPAQNRTTRTRDSETRSAPSKVTRPAGASAASGIREPAVRQDRRGTARRSSTTATEFTTSARSKPGPRTGSASSQTSTTTSPVRRASAKPGAPARTSPPPAGATERPASPTRSPRQHQPAAPVRKIPQPPPAPNRPAVPPQAVRKPRALRRRKP